MSALIRSELLRFRSRRLVKALAIVALLGIATIVVILAVKSHRGADEVFRIGDARAFIEGTSSLLAIAGWLIGTSFVGADWQAGSMTTLLTWQPRRGRVFAAKVIAAAVGVFAVTLALVLLFTALLWVVAATRGDTAGTNDVMGSLLTLDLRVAALASIGGTLGLALAMVARNTAAALGIAFVYLAIVEGLMRGLRPGWRAWLLGDNANVFLLARDGFPPIGRSLGTATVVLAVWCLAFGAIALATFRARDVG